MKKLSLLICIMQHKVSLTPARSQLPHFVTSKQPQQAWPVLSLGHQQHRASGCPETLVASVCSLPSDCWKHKPVLRIDGFICCVVSGTHSLCLQWGKRLFGILRGTGTGRCVTAASHPREGEGKTSKYQTPALKVSDVSNLLC